MAYLDGDDYLHGPRLVEWLRERVGRMGERCYGVIDDPNLARRMHGWQAEDRVLFYGALDKALARHGVHPTEIPEDVWIPGSRAPEDVIERAGTRGRPPKSLAA